MLSPFASWIAGKWKRVLKINIRDWTNLSNLNLSNVLFIIYTARKKTVSKFWSIPELIMQFSFNECTEMILATVGNITSSVICSHLPNYFPTLLVNLIPASSFPYEFSLKYSEWQLRWMKAYFWNWFLWGKGAFHYLKTAGHEATFTCPIFFLLHPQSHWDI